MKLNILSPTNLETELNTIRAEYAAHEDVVRQLNSAFSDQQRSINQFDFDQLDSDKIYHISSIKKTCIDFRLRFLDIKYFKSPLPKKAFEKIAALENTHNTNLSGFKIMAPSKMFVLEKTDDPLLFVPLGNDYFYLIHKWGKDLQSMRKLRMWPFKCIANLIVFTLLISGVATYLLPMGLFSKTNDWTSIWMVYFFMFKAIASIILYGGFAMGKNFNPAIWDSKYNKS